MDRTLSLWIKLCIRLTDKAVYSSGKYFTNPRDNPSLENFHAKTLRRFAPSIIGKKNDKIYYYPYIQDDDYIFLYGERYLKLSEDTSTLKMYHFYNDFVLHIAPDEYRLSSDSYDKHYKLKNPIIIDNSLVGFMSRIVLLEKGLHISGVVPFQYN